jgi:hypothetical protein
VRLGNPSLKNPASAVRRLARVVHALHGELAEGDVKLAAPDREVAHLETILW